MKKPTKTKAYSAKTKDLSFSGKSYPITKSFKATKSGKLISYTKGETPYYVGSGKVASTKGYSKTIVDTTGYSKGKQSFPASQTKYNPLNSDGKANSFYSSDTKSFDIPRNKVKKTIKEMKSNTGMLQKEKKAKAVKKPATSTKTMVDRYGNKTTKAFKPVAVNKSEAFKNGGKKVTSKMRKGGKKC